LNQPQKIEVDEDLPEFFDAIKLSQAHEVVSEFNNLKNKYGFETHNPETIRKLANAKKPERPIQGTPWYMPLSDEAYVRSFLYFGSQVEKREELIEDDIDFGEGETEEEKEKIAAQEK